MTQIIHIFKKDVRRHWPEILISLVLLGLYTRITLQGPPDRAAMISLGWIMPFAELVAPLMIFFWIFIGVRLVQGESLVGDRQWWVTKPYDWWKLLAAKSLFLVGFLCLPLFLVQLFLLHEAGFPILHNLHGVLSMQLVLAVTLLLPSMALGSLSKGVGQALIGIFAVIVVFWFTATVMQEIPSIGMSSAVSGFESIPTFLVLVSIIGATVWQYARRKTWAARGTIMGGAILILLIVALTPYAKFVDRKYPPVEMAEAPVQFAFQPAKLNHKKQNPTWDVASVVSFGIPLQVSGIPEGRAVVLDGINVVVETSGGFKLDRGWTGQGQVMWKGDQDELIYFQMKRKDYEKIKSENTGLHVEMALTEYQGSEERELILKEGEFQDVKLGICRLHDGDSSQIDCRRPFQYPSLMASFDPAKTNCHEQLEAGQIAEDKVSHVWFGPHDEDSSGAGLNPVDNYQLNFGSRSWNRTKKRVVNLCLGATMTLAKPIEKRHVRIKMEIKDVHLADLSGVESDSE